MNMTKRKKFAVAFLVVIAVIIIILFALFPRTADLSFADTIIVTNDYDGKTVVISRDKDKENFDKILKLCNKREVCDPFSIPTCMFEKYKLEFKKGSKSVTVYPANDGCDTMYMESKGKELYYNLDDDEKNELNNILENITE